MREPCIARQRFTTFQGGFMNRLMLAVLACIPVACSSDGTAPQASGIGGRWLYSVDGLSDGGAVSCTMTAPDTLALARSAVSVEGDFAGGTFQCRGADTEGIDLARGAVINGTVEAMVNGAQDVTFDLGGTSWHQDGSLAGDRMAGTLSVVHVFPHKLGRVLLHGRWTARKISSETSKPHPL
jgi:hypothetical protein